MSLYMLDTDICSYIIRNRPPEARQRMNAIPLSKQCISVVTLAELLYGVKRSSNATVNRAVVDSFISHLSVRDWDSHAAEHYGDIRASLQPRGALIGAMDMMIAAHARSLGAIIVTNNRRHFERVDGLLVETWLGE